MPTFISVGWEKHSDEDGFYYWHIKSGTIQVRKRLFYIFMPDKQKVITPSYYYYLDCFIAFHCCIEDSQIIFPIRENFRNGTPRPTRKTCATLSGMSDLPQSSTKTLTRPCTLPACPRAAQPRPSSSCPRIGTWNRREEVCHPQKPIFQMMVQQSQ